MNRRARLAISLALALSLPTPALLAQGSSVCPSLEALAPTPLQQAQLGRWVAIGGSTLVAGAPSADAAGLDSGTAQVWTHGGSGWSHAQTLLPADGAGSFGRGASTDGAHVVVGAPRYLSDGLGGPGEAYVYVPGGAGAKPWVLQQILPNPSSMPGDQFGTAVAVDGDWLAIADHRNEVAGVRAGSVFLYELVAGSWVLRQTIDHPEPDEGDHFGLALDLEGTRLVVGAPRWDASAASHDSGAAYVFDDPGGGAPWTLTHTLAPAAPSSGALFGHDVATSGATVVAGAPHDAQGVGEVHVFTFQAGQPAPEVLTAPAAAAGTFFGRAVALDGDLLSVGALHESSLASSAGAAHLYRPLPGGWSLAHTLLRCGGAADDGLGESVDVDGGRIAVGIPGADTTEGASSVGAVSVWSTLAEDCPLAVDTPTVSLAAGSTQTFAIQPPSSCAGNLFLLLGSFSLFDNEPIGGVSFPLNLLDSYFAHTLLYPNTPPLANSFGVLVPGGSTASFTLPTGLSPNLIGTCVYHAYVVIALAGPHAPCASNAVPALILP